MNKANRYRQRVYTQNDAYSNCTPKNITDQNDLYFTHGAQTSFNFTQQSDMLSRFTSLGKRVQTQPYQIEPFREISNFNLNGQKIKSFIKAKSAKLYLKNKNSNRENQQPLQPIKNSKRFESNFQNLKKQIQDIESLQILNVQTNQSKHRNPQTIDYYETYKSQITHEQFYSKMAIAGEFASGKNVSILEKKRQNIKKVLKNKKFRNYINPHKNIDKYLDKNVNETEQKPEEQKNIVSFISFNKNEQQSFSETNLKSDCWRKKETPQIIKKYYRPQSCSVKRQTPTKKQNKLKIQLINYISLKSITSKSLNKNNLSNIQVPSCLKIQSSKNQRKPHKELVIICI